jgi:hypothetical protein
VATFTGIGGNFKMVWVATLHRNQWQPCTGIRTLVVGAVVSRVNFGVIMGHTTVKHRPINDLDADKQANALCFGLYRIC